MSDYNTTAIYLIPGMQAKIGALNYFVRHGTQKYQDHSGVYQDATLVNGFYVADPLVGSIDPVPNEPAVIYTHKKFSTNKIVFVARTGEQGIVEVISVPIHDHSSIVTGGPAYATYFADDDNTEDA